MHQATLPCGSIWYRTIPISVLDTTTLEPGIGSIDTRYLQLPSPSTTCRWSHVHTWYKFCPGPKIALHFPRLLVFNLRLHLSRTQ